jgi:hypothetical protein
MSMATRKLFAAGAPVERESSWDGGVAVENPAGRGGGDFVVPRTTVGSLLLVLLFFAGVGVGVVAGSSAVSVSSELPAVALINALGKIWAKHNSEMTIAHRHIIALPTAG